MARILTVLAIAVILAGCIDAELQDPDATLTVLSTDTYAGSCRPRGPGDVDCHIVEVHVENRNQDQDLDTTRFNWKGITRNGSVYRAIETDGPHAVAAGGAATVTVYFDLPFEDMDRLASLRWDGFLSNPITTAIPSR